MQDFFFDIVPAALAECFLFESVASTTLVAHYLSASAAVAPALSTHLFSADTAGACEVETVLLTACSGAARRTSWTVFNGDVPVNAVSNESTVDIGHRFLAGLDILEECD